MWFLVKYKDDEAIRVLSELEIRNIFPEDDDEGYFEVGDIVSAIWVPNGRYYDAKILQKGVDRNELMRERLKLEKLGQKSSASGPGKEAQLKRTVEVDHIEQQKIKMKKFATKDPEMCSRDDFVGSDVSDIEETSSEFLTKLKKRATMKSKQVGKKKFSVAKGSQETHKVAGEVDDYKKKCSQLELQLKLKERQLKESQEVPVVNKEMQKVHVEKESEQETQEREQETQEKERLDKEKGTDRQDQAGSGKDGWHEEFKKMPDMCMGCIVVAQKLLALENEVKSLKKKLQKNKQKPAATSIDSKEDEKELKHKEKITKEDCITAIKCTAKTGQSIRELMDLLFTGNELSSCLVKGKHNRPPLPKDQWNLLTTVVLEKFRDVKETRVVSVANVKLQEHRNCDL